MDSFCGCDMENRCPAHSMKKCGIADKTTGGNHCTLPIGHEGQHYANHGAALVAALARPSADEGYMLIATAVGARGTCRRRSVGAIIVNHGMVVATGYNGAPRGLPDCLKAGCEMEHGHCIRTAHAEVNAIGQAGWQRCEGGTLYTTASPCRACMYHVINARIARVVYADAYKSATHTEDKGRWALDTGTKLGVRMDHLKGKDG